MKLLDLIVSICAIFISMGLSMLILLWAYHHEDLSMYTYLMKRIMLYTGIFICISFVGNFFIHKMRGK